MRKKSTSEMNTIGFVGVGRMGSNMARRLRDQGYTIGATYDVNAQAAQELAAEIGATPCQRLPEVTSRSDVVITVVTDDAAMRSIFGLDGEDDNLLVKASGKVFVNCATISPKCHLEVEKAAVAAGGSLAGGSVWPRASPRHVKELFI